MDTGFTAVVTGGGSGIGREICRRLAADGAAVAVLDIDLNAAEATASGLACGRALEVDVSDSAAVDEATALVEASIGPIGAWINCAGFAGKEHLDRVNERAAQQLREAATGAVTTPLDGLTRLSDEDWGLMLHVHLDGSFYGTRAAARVMVSRGSGAIVNVSSVCGMTGCAGHPHYSAAKAGILGLTRAAASELAPRGVRVNAVAPGYIETPMTNMLADTLRSALVGQTPLGRLGLAQEVASTVAYLVSDEASFVVGQTWSPNGGYLCT